MTEEAFETKDILWAQLLKRVFEIDVLQCPFCKGRRKLIAFITETPVIRVLSGSLKNPKTCWTGGLAISRDGW